MSGQSSLNRRCIVVLGLLASVVALLPTQLAEASVTLDFNSLVHGQIVDDDFAGAPHNVRISGENVGGGPDLIVAFDTFLQNTADPDLEDPFRVGNIARHNGRPDLMQDNLPRGFSRTASRFQRALIIQESGRDSDGDGFIDGGPLVPDDEGSRPAGSIFFDFDNPITSIGFDVLDIEGPEEFNNSTNGDPSDGFVASFLLNGMEIARVGFSEFISMGSDFYDATVEFGNNSANRIAPITVEQLSVLAGATIENFDRVEINFGGSAALDNLTYTPFLTPNQSLPEVSSMIVWVMLSLSAGSYRRRQSFGVARSH